MDKEVILGYILCVMNQFMQKGLTAEQAIEMIRKILA